MISFKLRSRLKSPRLLIVEDEVQLAEVSRTVLQNAGAKVKVIYDAADALESMESFQPDVIISDIKMPEMRGDELLAVLHDHGYNTPVILMTGLDKRKISLPRESPNLFALIHKPIDYDLLVRTIQNSLHVIEAHHLNEVLLQQLYDSLTPDVAFEQWRSEHLVGAIKGLNTRRAS